MLRLDIKKYVDSQFSNLNQFSKAAGLNYQAAQKIYNGETSRITFDNLESICKTLNVTPNDIFIFNDAKIESPKTLPILHSINIDSEKLKHKSNSALYELVSNIVDKAIEEKLQQYINETDDDK